MIGPARENGQANDGTYRSSERRWLCASLTALPPGLLGEGLPTTAFNISGSLMQQARRVRSGPADGARSVPATLGVKLSDIPAVQLISG